jgi:hypothetical protein
MPKSAYKKTAKSYSNSNSNSTRKHMAASAINNFSNKSGKHMAHNQTFSKTSKKHS